MTFVITENRLGLPPIGSIELSGQVTNQQVGQSPLFNGKTVPLGTIVRGDDPTLGEGEFIYLVGVASTAVGSLVTYNAVAGTTTLAPATAGLDNPLAVATAATTAHNYGWYQISGVAAVAKAAVKISPAVKVYLAGSGQVTGAAATGKSVFNAISVNAATVASATATVNVQINRPFANPIAAGL